MRDLLSDVVLFVVAGLVMLILSKLLLGAVDFELVRLTEMARAARVGG